MELLAILRLLWDRRYLVGLGVLVAIGAGLAAGSGRTAQVGSGLGSLRMVLDTSDSQLLEAAPVGATTLPTRAALLADTMTTDGSRALVARAAGIPVSQLTILGPAATSPPIAPDPLVTQVSATAATGSTPYVVDVIADDVTPIISIAAYAPDRARAGRLAAAAGGALRSLLVTEDGTRSRGFVLETFSPVRTRQIPGAATHRRVLMAGGAIVVFALWCSCIVIIAGISRRTRRERLTRAA